MAAEAKRRGGGAAGPHPAGGEQRPGAGDGLAHRLDPERGPFHRLQQATAGRVQASHVGGDSPVALSAADLKDAFFLRFS